MVGEVVGPQEVVDEAVLAGQVEARPGPPGSVAKPWRRKYSLGSRSSLGRTHMWCLRYASSMASSSHGTQPMPASTAPKRSLGWRSATPDAQTLTIGSMVGASEWTV